MSIPQTPSPLSNIIASKTYNAAWFSGSTKELQITAAVAAAVTDGALYVYVPSNMLPYNAANVTFNIAVRMICEGKNPGDYVPQAYGAAGDGLIDDTSALKAWYAAIPAGGTGSVPLGIYKFISQLSWNSNVNVIGEGWGSMFFPSGIGAVTDGIVVNNSVGSFVYGIEHKGFSVANPAVNCCRNAIVYNRVMDSQIDIRLETAAANYQIVVNGCLISRGPWQIMHSTNGTWPYLAPFNRGEATLGTLHVTYDTVNAIGVNDMHFHVVIEGGAAGIIIDDQTGQGNIELSGCIEGLTGGTYSLYAKGCAGLTIHNMHMESNVPNVTLDSCVVVKIGGGVLIIPALGGTLFLIGCFDTIIDGATIDTLNVDSACKRVRTGAFKYNVSGAGGIAGTGAATQLVPMVPMINGANGLNDTSIDAAATTPGAGFFRKGDFVPNNNPLITGGAGSQYVIRGFVRLTTGSTHVYGTDWIMVRELTGT